MEEGKPGRKKGQYSITTEAMKEALRLANGQVYVAAKMLKCNHVTIYQRFKEFPELREYAQSFKEVITDQIEQVLIKKAIQDEDLQAATYWLSTQAKHRGYTKREEITGADGGSFKVQIDNLNEALERVWGRENNSD